MTPHHVMRLLGLREGHYRELCVGQLGWHHRSHEGSPREGLPIDLGHLNEHLTLGLLEVRPVLEGLMCYLIYHHG